MTWPAAVQYAPQALLAAPRSLHGVAPAADGTAVRQRPCL